MADKFDPTIKNNGMSAFQYIAHLKDVYKNNKGFGGLIGVGDLFEKTTEPAEEVVIPIGLLSDENGIKEYHWKKRKTDYRKFQGSQKLSEEMPPRVKTKRRKEESRKSLRQTYAVHNATDEAMLELYSDDITSFELPPKNPSETINDISTFILENRPTFSSDPKTGKIVITDRRGKVFEPVYDEEGRMTEMMVYGGEAKSSLQSDILQKIITVEKLSKELIDKSVKAGIEAMGYCGAVNILHEIANSGGYNPKEIRLAARYAQGELEELKTLPAGGTQAHIVNIGNSLRELSEI